VLPRAAIWMLLLGAACSSDQSGPGGSGASLSVVNGASAAGTVKVYVDGSFAGNVAVAERGAKVELDPGAHQVEVRRSDGSTGFARSVTVQADMPMTVVAYDSLGLLRPAVLEDSNAVVAPGKSKLRVAHFAETAGQIDIWRTQPDFGTPIRLMFPFNYRDVSPYVESTPGAWRVLVSTAISAPTGPMPDTLAMTGTLTVGDGEARTVVVVDRPGGGIEAIAIDP
jgi:hypothetical protein